MLIFAFVWQWLETNMGFDISAANGIGNSVTRKWIKWDHMILLSENKTSSLDNWERFSIDVELMACEDPERYKYRSVVISDASSWLWTLGLDKK